MVKDDALAAALDALCRAHGLTQPGNLRHWTEANDVAEDARRFEDESQVQSLDRGIRSAAGRDA